MPRPEFYLRYYVGHRGKFGHEFMEFEFASTGKLRYANNSNYKNDSMIRKEVTVSDAVLDEIERIITDAEITKEDDADWYFRKANRDCGWVAKKSKRGKKVGKDEVKAKDACKVACCSA